jgi:hypothetical protein
MDINTLVVIGLLFAAVTDTVLAKFILPGILAKNSVMKPEAKAAMLRTINVSTYFFAACALIIYFVRPF